MRYTLLIIVLVLSFAVRATDKELILPEFSYYGILIKPLGEQAPVESYQSHKSFAPASVMKLITTATALEKLGAEYRYMTRLEYSGEIVDGVLRGNVMIKGDGDPTLGSKHFYEHPEEFLDVWVRELQVLGIERIEGTVVADASVFDKQVIPDKWIWEDIGNYYGAGCYGLSCFDNKYDLYFGKAEIDGIAPVDSVVPDCERLMFECHVTGADNNRDNAYIYGSPWGFKRQIYGTIPAGRESFKIKGAMPNPPLMLAQLLKQKMEDNGIVVEKEASVCWEEMSEPCTGISIWFSPRLADIVKVTNKESNNLFAEHLLKSIAVGEKSATLNVAIDSLMAFWKQKGLNTDGVKIYDGSGLSRATLLTPEFIVALINYMSRSSNSDDYLASLAVSGVDGTFRWFLDGTPLEGKVYGKSGSMSGVRCYAGIVEKSSEEKYIFCIMVNNFTCSQSQVIKAIEGYLCEKIAPSSSP